MIRIAIVDDDALVRAGFASIIPWNELGIEIRHSFSTGPQLLAVLENQPVDILFTDIKMPQMSGLELIRIVRADHPGIRIVALSSYDDIDLVKTAFKGGAVDYLLKSRIDSETLLPLISDVTKSISTSGQRAADESGTQKPQTVSHSLFDYLNSGIAKEELVSVLSAENPSLIDKKYFIAAADITPPDASDREDEKSRSLRFRALVTTLTEKYRADPRIMVFEMASDRILLVCALDARKSTETAIPERVMTQITATVRDIFGCGVSWGIVDGLSRIDRLPAIKDKALLALKMCFYEPPSRTVRVGQDFLPEDPSDLFGVLDDEYLESLITRDFKRAKKTVASMADMLRRNPRFDVDTVRVHFSALCLTAFIADHIPPGGGVSSPAKRRFESKFMRARSISEVKSVLDEIISSLESYHIPQRAGTLHPGIVRSLRYIHDHKRESLTLDQVASIASLSRTYFSKLFHDSLGETFTNYVNQVKMEHARYLVEDVGVRIGDAMDTVGILDASYFGKLYKRFNGHSPSSEAKCVSGTDDGGEDTKPDDPNNHLSPDRHD